MAYDYGTYHRTGLYRSRDGMLAGVCRGIADYFDLSVFWLRAIPMPEYFDMETHWEQVNRLIEKYQTPRGIETNEQRFLLIVQK